MTWHVLKKPGFSTNLPLICYRTFADGFPNLFVPNAHGIRGEHVAFLASFSSPAVIFEQLSIIYALPRMFVSSFTLVLPFFPTGTLERMEDEGDIATAFTLARILSNIPCSRGGPSSLVIFDIHALQVSSHLPVSQHLLTYLGVFGIQSEKGCFSFLFRKDSTLVTMSCHALRVVFPYSSIVSSSFQTPTM
jgi:phosphoribosylpyrophosphate synthetase